MGKPATRFHSRLLLTYHLRRAGFFVLLFAILLHFGWAILLFVSNTELRTTPTAYLLAFMSPRTTSALLLLVGSLAALGIYYPTKLPKAQMPWYRRWIGLMLTLPQMFVLFMAAASGAASVFLGRYPDGTIPIDPHFFIATDQLLTVLFAFLHGISVIVYHGNRWSLSG